MCWLITAHPVVFPPVPLYLFFGRWFMFDMCPTHSFNMWKSPADETERKRHCCRPVIVRLFSQVNWRIRLQVDLQTLCHTVLCVLCGLVWKWTGHFRSNPGTFCFTLWCSLVVLIRLLLRDILTIYQVFVETLDKCFENVCELDLIFHVDKVGKPSNTFPCFKCDIFGYLKYIIRI